MKKMRRLIAKVASKLFKIGRIFALIFCSGLFLPCAASATEPYGWDDIGFWVGVEIIEPTTLKWPGPGDIVHVDPVNVPVANGKLYCDGFFAQDGLTNFLVEFLNSQTAKAEFVQFAFDYMTVLGYPHTLPDMVDAVIGPDSIGIGLTFDPNPETFLGWADWVGNTNYDFFDWFEITGTPDNCLVHGGPQLTIIQPNPARYRPKPQWRVASNLTSLKGSTNGIISFAGDSIALLVTSGSPFHDYYLWNASSTLFQYDQATLEDSVEFLADGQHAGLLQAKVANSFGAGTTPVIPHYVAVPRIPISAPSRLTYLTNLTHTTSASIRAIDYSSIDDATFLASSEQQSSQTVSRVFKLNNQDQVVWTYLLTNWDVQAVAADGAGGVFCGAAVTVPAGNATGLRLAHLGSAGNLLWSQVISDDAVPPGQSGLADKVTGVSVGTNQSVFLAGLALGANQGTSPLGPPCLLVDAKLTVAKFSASGVQLFFKQEDVGGLDSCVDTAIAQGYGGIAALPDGGCLLTTAVFGNVSINGANCFTGQGYYPRSAVVGSLNSAGQWRWTECIQGSPIADICGPVIDSSGACYLAGTFYNQADVCGTPLDSYCLTSADAFLLQMNTQGVVGWVRQLPSTNAASTGIDSLVLARRNQGCLLGGQFDSGIGFFGDSMRGDSLATPSGTPNAFVCGYDANGHTLSPLIQFGQTNYAQPTALCSAANGAVILGGTEGPWNPYNVQGIIAHFGNGASCSQPAIFGQPLRLTVTAGSNAQIPIAAEGTLPLHYQWFKNTQLIAGATTDTLTIASASTSDDASYNVVVTNGCGSTTSATVHLTVSTFYTGPAVSITNSGGPPIAVVNQSSLNLAGTASDPNGVTTVIWTNNLGGSGVAVGQGAWNISNLPLQTGLNQITITASNTTGQSQSTHLLATFANVSPPTDPVWIAQEPPESLSAPAGTSTSLSVLALGGQPINYQWFFNGTKLATGTNSTFVIAHLQATNAGSYQVVITNAYGSVTSSVATITVITPPSIVSGSARRLVNGSFTFSISCPSGHSLVVQTSTNLLNWVTVINYTNPPVVINFNDPAPLPAKRFYRALISEF